MNKPTRSTRRFAVNRWLRIASDLIQLFTWKARGLRAASLYLRSPIWIDDPSRVTIGENTYFGPYVHVTVQSPDGYLQIGKDCEINPFSSFLCGNGIEIGDNVLIGPQLCIVTSTNAYQPNWLISSNPHSGGPVRIGDNVHIGARVTILPNITIGEGAVIGAGAVVTGDIPSGAVAYGVPCRVKHIRQKDDGDRTLTQPRHPTHPDGDSA